MTFIPALDTVQVQLYGREDGQTTINDLYFVLQTGPMTPTVVAGLLENVCSWYAGSIGSLASTAWSFVRGHARDLTTEFSFTADNALHTTPGGVGGNPAPNNVSFAISFRTLTGGRSGRGRNYVPGIPEFSLSGNQYSTDFITNVTNAYTALISPSTVVGTEWVWSVLSRFSAGAPRTTGLTIPITAVVAVDNVVDSQRRRLPGRGR